MEVKSIFLLLIVQVSGVLSVCPQHYFEYGGHCYRIADEHTNWTNAVDACQREGGDLVSVNSAQENNFLKGIFPRTDHGFWLGLVYTNNSYVWLDGSVAHFTDWGGRNPSCMAGHIHCKALFSPPLGYKWADVNDDFDSSYVCELDPTQLAAVCPHGYSEHGGHCYRIVLQHTNWTNAVDACQSEGGDLVSINSPEENAFLREQLPSSDHGFWIGLVYSNDKYMWLDGSEAHFTYWGGRNPSCMAGHLHCKALFSPPLGYRWADVNDDFDSYYICELDPTKMTITSSGSSSSQVPGSSVDIKLYTDPAFSQPLQGSVNVGTPVYVQVLSRGHPYVAMMVESCDANSETSSSQNQTTHPLIQHHCSADPGTDIIMVRNQVTRFSFNMFDRPDKNSDIYVTCNIKFCNPLDFSSQCGQICHTGSNLIG